jgi:hypothetical protein
VVKQALIRVLCAAWVLTGLSGRVTAQVIAGKYTHQAFQQNYTVQSFRIPMRDGARLFTTIYCPKNMSQKWPILMYRTPYGIDPDPYVPGVYAEQREMLHSMLREGYIVVEQDVRGRFYSEGTWVNVRPQTAHGKGQADDATDTYDSIEWLLKSIPNNNGNVGIWGISYPGFYAMAAGINSHPALKAISPQAPVSDWFMGDDNHHNGVLMMMDTVRWFNSMGRERANPAILDDNYLPEPDLKFGPDIYKFYQQLGPLANVDSRYFKGEIKHWTDIVNHPDYDAWWQARALPKHIKGVGCAVLMTGGWYDAEDRYGPRADHEAIAHDGKSPFNGIVMGPWSHGGWSGGDGDSFGDEKLGIKTAAYYRERLFKPFFDHYLKGQGEWKQKEATLFATGSNAFWQFDSWPPKQGVTQRKMWLAPAKALTESRPADAISGEYVSDPAHPVPYTGVVAGGRNGLYLNEDQRFAAARADVLSFATEPLKAPLYTAGYVNCHLKVETDATDADFVVKIIDVQPDGFQRLVLADIMRARWRNGFDKAMPLPPGKAVEVGFNLGDMCHTFLPGHRLMVQVQSSWFPLADANPQSFVPNIYAAKPSDFRSARIKIYADSRVEIPVLKAAPVPVPVGDEYLGGK